MAKKGGAWLLLLAGAIAGLGLYSGDKLYRSIVEPDAGSDEDEDFSELVASGRLFVRNHKAHQDVYLDAIDLVKLHAVYLEAKNPADHRYAILIHGINDNCESMGIFAEHYEGQGMHVLLPDLRGFGKSEGNYVGFGYDDRMDIIEWIYWILKRDPEAKILLHGVSMGAAAVLMTVGEHLPSNVCAAVSDSSYSDLKEEFNSFYNKYKKSVVPFALQYELLRAETKARAGYDLNEVSPIKAVERSRTPILFIHGDADRLIPSSMATALYEAAGSRKKIATFLGADHIECIVTDPEKYWEQVHALLQETGLL